MSDQVHLQKVAEFSVEPKKPFNFQMTFEKPSHFRSVLTVWQGERYYQGIFLDHKVFGISVSEKREGVLLIEVFGKRIPKATEIECLKEELIFRFDLSGDISDFFKKFKNDEMLKSAMKCMFGAKPSCAYNLYEFLIVSTLLQNTVVGRTISMLDNLISNYGRALIFDGVKVGVLFEPEKMSDVSEESLRGLKIGYRAKNIKRISDIFVRDKTLENRLRKMNKEGVRKELLKIYGVGTQTVEYLLFEYFHHYDALDHISPWEGKILGKIIFDRKDTQPNKILRFLNRRYGTWRALAAHYLFENLFWRHRNESVGWLSEEIRT